MAHSRFDTEQEANAYKREHQLTQRVAETIAGGKWGLVFPLNAHITVQDGSHEDLREHQGKMQRSTQDHFINGMRYPLAVDAKESSPVPCEFKVGDLVTFTNDCGVVFPDMIVTGFSPTVEHGRFVYFDASAWWFPVSPESLKKQLYAEAVHETSDVECSAMPRG